MIAHCELMGDRMAILDPPPGHECPAGQGVADRQGTAMTRNTPALYWPWIKATDPAIGQMNIHMPPSAVSRGGHLGSQRRHPRCAQGSRQRGRSAAPSQLEDTDHQERARSAEPQWASTASGRSLVGGIRVWGARTLSSDPAWRYLNVRQAVQLPGGVDPQRERTGSSSSPTTTRCGRKIRRTISRLPGDGMAGKERIVRAHTGRGLLRQV